RVAKRKGDGERSRSRARWLKLLLQSFAGAEEQRFDRGRSHAEGVASLFVREPVELTQDHGLPLLLRQLGERRAQSLDLGALRSEVLDLTGGRRAFVDENERCCHAFADPRSALVASYRPEPGSRIARLSSREHAPMGGEKDLLRGVLRAVRVAQEEPAE